MVSSFFLSLREGLEAALIIGVLLGTIRKLDHPKYFTPVWVGTSLAVILSIVIGIALNLLGATFEGRAEQIFEGVAMVSAAAILTWAILWMQSQARAINKKLESDVKQAVMKGSKTALLTLAFLAVIREGVELAFFLTAASMNAGRSQVLTGAVLGLVAVVILAGLLYKSLLRLNLSKFFQVTSVILILFAAGLVAHGIHEFNEAGVIPAVIEHVWDINHIISEESTVGELLKALVGYNANPSLSEVVAYLLYFVVLWSTGKVLARREQKLVSLLS